MKSICSWCGRLISDGETNNGLVSHGMCETCAATQMAALEAEQAERAWAREALDESTPRCVLEQLADGMAPIEAVAEAMTLLRAISENPATKP